MIRLNAFFEVKEGVTLAQVKNLTDELVEKSLQDEGNKGYDLFESTTRPGVYLFCETWESEEALSKHSKTEHFTRIVGELSKLYKEEAHTLERFEK